MTAEWREGRIVRIEKHTSTITSFFFDLTAAFVAGQHVDVRLTAEDGYRAERSYSIASAPGAPLELAIERLPDGEVSTFFHDVARVGDVIELSRPRGEHFVWSPDDGDGPLLFLGGGSGVVPLLAMLRHHRIARSRAPVAMLVAARTRADVPFHDELRAGGARFALSREPGGDYGRLDAAVVGDLLATIPAPARVYVCGSNRFVGAASDAVIANGAPAALVRTERYG